MFTPVSDFNWQVDNYGSTYSDTGIGTNVPGNASVNQKGANTQLLTGLAEDCYGISIHFSGGSTTGTGRTQLTDLIIDPGAGVGGNGSSWSVLIANLLTGGPADGATGSFGHEFYFPLFLKAGTAIGAAHQDGTGSTQALRVAVRAYGKPSRPDLLRVGTKVQTLGATTASTTGTAVTPGTNAMGSYSSSLGTTSFDAWWWQIGVACAFNTQTNTASMWDAAVNATNKIIVAQGIRYNQVGTAEQSSKSAMGCCPPIRNVASGQDVYVRAAGMNGAPIGSMSAVVYAVGG